MGNHAFIIILSDKSYSINFLTSHSKPDLLDISKSNFSLENITVVNFSGWAQEEPKHELREIKKNIER